MRSFEPPRARRSADLARAAPTAVGLPGAHGGVDAIQVRVERLEARRQRRVGLAQGVDALALAQHQQAEARTVEARELALDLVDADVRPAGQRHRVVLERHAAELFDLDEVGEGVLRVDERVDLLETLSRVLEQVDLLPAPGGAQPALAVAQPLHAAARFVEQARRQRAEFLEGEAVGVDGAFEAQERQDLGARRAVAGRQAMVVQQHPDGEHDVEIGIVREDVPLALAQIEAAQQQHHGLLAGRQREGAHTALVVIEVVDAAHRVREGLALRGAVQEDRAGRRVARLRRAHAAAALDPHREGRRLDTDELASARLLADLVALRGVQRAHRRARELHRRRRRERRPGLRARRAKPRLDDRVDSHAIAPLHARRPAAPADPRAASSRRPGPAVTPVTDPGARAAACGRLGGGRTHPGSCACRYRQGYVDGQAPRNPVGCDRRLGGVGRLPTGAEAGARRSRRDAEPATIR